MPVPQSIDLDLKINEASVVRVYEGMRKVVKGIADGTIKDVNEIGKAVDELSKQSVLAVSRTVRTNESLVRSFERQAMNAGKTVMEQITNRANELRERVKGNVELLEKIAAAERQLIEIERNKPGGEAMKAAAKEAQEAKNALALVGMEFGVHIPRQIRSFLATLPGVASAISAAFNVVAIIGMVDVIGNAIESVIKFRKELEKLHDLPKQITIEFGRMTDEFHRRVLEQQILDDKIRVSLDKLEKKPEGENRAKLALDEAALAAENFKKQLDDALQSYENLLKGQQPGGWLGQLGMFTGMLTSNEDIQKATRDYMFALQAGGKTATEGRVTYNQFLQREMRKSQYIEAWRTGARSFEGIPMPGEGLGLTKEQRTSMGIDLSGVTVPSDQTSRILQLRAGQAILKNQADLEAKTAQTEEDRKREERVTAEKHAQDQADQAAKHTEELHQQKMKALTGELFGVQKLEQERKDALAHEREEARTNEVVGRNLAKNLQLINQTYDAKEKNYRLDEERKTQQAELQSQQSRAEDDIRRQHERFTARRKVEGDEFGAADIEENYRFEMALADQAAAAEKQHIEDLRKENRDAEEIKRAELKATDDDDKRRADLRLQRQIQYWELDAKARKDAETAQRNAFENEKRYQDTLLEVEQRAERDRLQKQIQRVTAQAEKYQAPQAYAIIEQLQIQAAQLEHDQARQKLQDQMAEAEALPQRTLPEQEARAKAIVDIRIEGVKIEADLRRKMEDAEEERVNKMIALIKQQTDQIAKTIEPLYQTLFEHPGKFPGQLKSTLHEAMMRPIYQGMSQMTARALHPLIYGAEGKGGIAGVFHGIFGGNDIQGLDKLRLQGDGSVPVTVVGSMLTENVSAGAHISLPGGSLYRMGIPYPQVGTAAPSSAGAGRFGGWGIGWGWGGMAPRTRGVWDEIPDFGAGAGTYIPPAAPSQEVVTSRLIPEGEEAGAAPGGGWMPSTATPLGAAAPMEGPTTTFGTGTWFPAFGNAPIASAMPWGTQGVTGGGRSRFGSLIGGLAGLLGGGGGEGGGFGYPQWPNTPPIVAPGAVGSSGVWSEIPGGPGGVLGLPGGTPVDVSQLPGATVQSTPMKGDALQYKLQRFGINKADWFNQDIATQAGGGVGGTLAGIATSKGAVGLSIAGGENLAMAGLAGQRRGTAGGFGESVGGGALMGAGIGFMFGGPMGAAIGAGIGALAGATASLLEMAFGVESPRNEAVRLVKSRYGLSINNSTADQIVDIANKSYAGRVSLAVNSPEVRHMLGLYAAGTGQAGQMKAITDQPYGASLVESGGRLMQQATYQYGQAHSYSSNLPVYGGVNTIPLSAPGGGSAMSLSLNIGGTDASTFLQGHVVTPEVVQQQYASAMYQSQGRAAQALQYSQAGAILS